MKKMKVLSYVMSGQRQAKWQKNDPYLTKVPSSAP